MTFRRSFVPFPFQISSCFSKTRKRSTSSARAKSALPHSVHVVARRLPAGTEAKSTAFHRDAEFQCALYVSSPLACFCFTLLFKCKSNDKSIVSDFLGTEKIRTILANASSLRTMKSKPPKMLKFAACALLSCRATDGVSLSARRRHIFHCKNNDNWCIWCGERCCDGGTSVPHDPYRKYQ